MSNSIIILLLFVVELVESGYVESRCDLLFWEHQILASIQTPAIFHQKFYFLPANTWQGSDRRRKTKKEEDLIYWYKIFSLSLMFNRLWEEVKICCKSLFPSPLIVWPHPDLYFLWDLLAATANVLGLQLQDSRPVVPLVVPETSVS